MKLDRLPKHLLTEQQKVIRKQNPIPWQHPMEKKVLGRLSFKCPFKDSIQSAWFVALPFPLSSTTFKWKIQDSHQSFPVLFLYEYEERLVIDEEALSFLLCPKVHPKKKVVFTRELLFLMLQIPDLEEFIFLYSKMPVYKSVLVD